MSEKILSGIVFGPVPSRRLGRSLGINNIPPKYCSYSCIYCQLGRNKKIGTAREVFYDPSAVLEQVENKISAVYKAGGYIDYLSFVPDGEPTLDFNIGRTIRLLKRTGLKIAVITNSSLITEQNVRKDLMEADWVSLKIDSVEDDTWRKINRPYRSLELKNIKDGMLDFSKSFKGVLATETMLVDDLNTSEYEIAGVADFIKSINPALSYISIPLRPPAESFALPPDESSVNRAYQIFSDKSLRAECITGHEGNEFSRTGDVVEDILSITSVHPMREDSMKLFLSEAGVDWGVIEKLIREDKISETVFNSSRYYLRKFNLIKY